jgi:hypothetical protein
MLSLPSRQLFLAECSTKNTRQRGLCRVLFVKYGSQQSLCRVY